MRRKITIKNASLTGRQLLLQVNESIRGLIPKGQILVDSDHIAFIYLMEDAKDYTYIELPEAIWPDLKAALGNETPVWLGFMEENIELIDFNVELLYVLQNIQGNSNYGEEMVKKVENCFF